VIDFAGKDWRKLRPHGGRLERLVSPRSLAEAGPQRRATIKALFRAGLGRTIQEGQCEGIQNLNPLSIKSNNRISFPSRTRSVVPRPEASELVCPEFASAKWPDIPW
jgi:hypothetical protein